MPLDVLLLTTELIFQMSLAGIKLNLAKCEMLPAPLTTYLGVKVTE